jgi:hypothetical protein
LARGVADRFFGGLGGVRTPRAAPRRDAPVPELPTMTD